MLHHPGLIAEWAHHPGPWVERVGPKPSEKMAEYHTQGAFIGTILATLQMAEKNLHAGDKSGAARADVWLQHNHLAVSQAVRDLVGALRHVIDARNPKTSPHQPHCPGCARAEEFLPAVP